MPPAGSSRGKVAHGSILSDSFGGRRVNSQWQSTGLGTPEFAPALTAAIRTIVPYEFTVIFAYYRDNRPLDMYDDFSAPKRKVMVDE
jgi:hypothetical protein